MHGLRYTKAIHCVPLKVTKYDPRTALQFQPWLVSKQLLNMEGLARDFRFTCLLVYALRVFRHVLWIFCIMLHLHALINEHQSEYLKTSVVASTPREHFNWMTACSKDDLVLRFQCVWEHQCSSKVQSGASVKPLRYFQLNWVLNTLTGMLSTWDHKPGSYQHRMDIKYDYFAAQ